MGKKQKTTDSKYEQPYLGHLQLIQAHNNCI